MRKWNENQLRFDLPELDEPGDDARERGISAEEARLISEAARTAFEARRRVVDENGEGEAPHDWVGEYVRLRELGWPWRVACYIAWAASPKEQRRPKTLAGLATEVLGLTGPRVIYEWRRKYASIDAVVSMMQAAPLWEHRRDVIEALVSSARQADYKNFNDRKLFLEMTGDYVPRSQVEVGKAAAEGLEELTDAELAEMAGMGGENLTPGPFPEREGGEEGEEPGE